MSKAAMTRRQEEEVQKLLNAAIRLEDSLVESCADEKYIRRVRTIISKLYDLLTLSERER